MVPGLVDAAEQAMDEAGMPTAHIVGNSLGGWVALEPARRGRARSVVGLSPAGAWRNGWDLTRLLTLFRVAGALGSSGPVRSLLSHAPIVRSLLRLVSEHPERMAPDTIRDVLDDLAGCAVLSDLLGGARATGGVRPFRPSCPVLLAWGDHDRVLLYLRHGAPMRADVAGAEFGTVPGVGHVPMPDDPEPRRLDHPRVHHPCGPTGVERRLTARVDRLATFSILC